MSADKETAFVDLLKSGDLDAMRRRLHAEPGLASARDANGVSNLVTALYFGRKDFADFMLEFRSADSLDAFEAAAVGNVGRVRALVHNSDALLHTLSPDGWSLLHYAAFFGHPELARFLLESGARPDIRSANSQLNLPLHAAMPFDHVEVARLLLDFGADPNVRQHGGYTAIQSAAHRGSQAMVRLLLDRGADPALKTDAGQSAFDFAAEKGHTAVLEMLKR